MRNIFKKDTKVNTGYVSAEGGEIYYEIRGTGEPLLMISGGGGYADFYSLTADILSDEYTVITYDRRGNSRSAKRDLKNFEISQQSRDAAALINSAGFESAYVFGNSGGAVIALDMAKTQPKAVRAMVVHEPPVIRILPDSEKWLTFFSELYHTAYESGTGAAMKKFGATLEIPIKTKPKISIKAAKRMGENDEYFLKHEMLSFTNYMPDIEMIKKNGVKTIMAAGEITLAAEKYYGITAPVLAKMLDCEMVTFPGHHISYLDMPEEWSSVLRDVLHRL